MMMMKGFERKEKRENIYENYAKVLRAYIVNYKEAGRGERINTRGDVDELKFSLDGAKWT